MIRAVQHGVSNAGVPTISENWSGYAVTSTKKFNYVSAEFVQPAVTCPGVKKQYTSNWVGLDGFNDETVEQDGTFAYCGGPNWTTPKYEAWYEMYPAGSVGVFKVKPGDTMLCHGRLHGRQVRPHHRRPHQRQVRHRLLRLLVVRACVG